MSRKVWLATVLSLLAVACAKPVEPSTAKVGEGLENAVPDAPESASVQPTDPVIPKLRATLPFDQLPVGDEIARSTRKVEGVQAVARVGLGMVETDAKAGKAGITVVAVDPSEFRPLAPQATSEADFVWRGLQSRQVFLAHEEYRRLGVKPSDTMFVRGPSNSLLVRVGGIAANGIPNLAGALISRDHAAALGLGQPSEILVGLKDGQQPEAMKKTLAELVPSARYEVIPSGFRGAFLTGPAAEKLFGAFTYTVNSDGSIVPDAEWVKKYIISKKVPILGVTKCHRSMFPQLEGALREIEQEGFAPIIDTKDYGGCYNARLIRGEDPADPHSHLSMHAWGLAVDINVSTNQMGAVPTLDSRIVSIFERWGFRWGGRWVNRPDGMHFELAGVLRELIPTPSPTRKRRR